MRKGLCREYRKSVPKESTSTIKRWEAVLIISIEDHPIYGYAEYFFRIGHPHGYSAEGLSNIISDYTEIPTPSDKVWVPRHCFDLQRNGFTEGPYRTYKVLVRWEYKGKAKSEGDK